MVSQAQVLDRPVLAKSVTSGISCHSQRGNRHRSTRSHQGNSSYRPQNDFPVFTHTGDVEIVIRAGAQERRYLLHRLILAQCSGFFKASTNERLIRRTASSKPEATLSQTSELSSLSNGPTLAQSDYESIPGVVDKERWRFELDWKGKARDEEPVLIQKDPNFSSVFGRNQLPPCPPATTKPSSTQVDFFRSMTNSTGVPTALDLALAANKSVKDVDPIIRDYENLFRLFYNYPPIVNSINIATAYSECKSLLALANMYDALPVTGPRVDHHLLGFGSRLFRQIAKYPHSYLKLGYLARSRVIFSEALIHVVGQWPTAAPCLHSAPYTCLPRSVFEIIEDKVDDLEDLKARVDSKLFRLTLTTSRGERVNPANAYLDWLAVSLFRQWFVETTTPPSAPILKSSPQGSRQSGADKPLSRPNGTYVSAQAYHLIGSSSTQAYLAHDDLKRFLKGHPASPSGPLYTREVLSRFEHKMDEIKRLAKDIVKPLMRNFLELELKPDDRSAEMRLPYLTCTRVGDEDIPWR